MKTYCQYRLRSLSNTNTLDIKKLQQECETSNIRLFVPLLVHCYINHRNVDSPSQLSRELEKMQLFNPAMDENEILEYLKNTEDYESVRFVQSFRSSNMRKDKTEMKNLGRRLILQYKNRYSLSYVRLAQMCGAHASNLGYFLKKKDNNRLSSKKINLLIDNLVKNYGPLN